MYDKVSKFCFALIFTVSVASLCVSSVSAQDGQIDTVTEQGEEVQQGIEDKLPEFEPIKKTYDLSKITSLFFTFKQQQAIQNAKADRKRNGVVRPPSQAELDALERGELYETEQVFIREIALGGIVYNNEDDWTIWLNEQRVTPEAIPTEVLSLNVSKDFIELRWFDEKTDNVYPIRLRAHQRFNMDARIFLTGE